MKYTNSNPINGKLLYKSNLLEDIFGFNVESIEETPVIKKIFGVAKGKNILSNVSDCYKIIMIVSEAGEDKELYIHSIERIKEEDHFYLLEESDTSINYCLPDTL